MAAVVSSTNHFDTRQGQLSDDPSALPTQSPSSPAFVYPDGTAPSIDDTEHLANGVLPPTDQAATSQPSATPNVPTSTTAPGLLSIDTMTPEATTEPLLGGLKSTTDALNATQAATNIPPELTPNDASSQQVITDTQPDEQTQPPALSDLPQLGIATSQSTQPNGIANAQAGTVPPLTDHSSTLEISDLPQATQAIEPSKPDTIVATDNQTANNLLLADPKNAQVDSDTPQPDIAISCVQTTPKAVPIQQDAPPAPSQQNFMHLTALGAHILSSSIQPVAAVDPPHEAVLTTVIGVDVPGPQRNAQQDLTVPVISIANSTAPSDLPHAKVWSTAIQAAQNGHDLIVNGEKLDNPSLASVDANGNIVRVALADVVSSTPGASIEVSKAATTPLVPVTSAIAPNLLASAPITGVELPIALTAHQGSNSGPVSPIITTPPGFVLAGSMKLFNVLDAERYVFQGTSSSDGKSEMVVPLISPLPLDQLIHNDGASFGEFWLVKPSISHYPKKTNSGRGPGLYVDATTNFIGALSEIGDDLRSIFRHSGESVQISASLGDFGSWSAALKSPPDFSFLASIPRLDAPLGEFVAFTSTNITFQAILTPHPTDSNQRAYAWAHLFTGQLNMTTPGSITPLSLDYSLTRQGRLCSLDMHLHESHTWINAMGVPGLHLFDVHFATQFDQAATTSSHAFTLDATLKVESADLKVTGSYQNDKWSINASLGNMEWTQLDDLYMELFGERLHLFDHNISFQDLELGVSSESKELMLHGHLNVDDWCQLVSKITIANDGFHLEATVGKAIFQHVTLEDAKLDIFVGKQGDIDADPEKPGTAASFIMTGTIDAVGLKLDATAYLDKDPKLGLLWIVYAKCPTHVHLSQLLGIGNRSDLDVVLENIAVMAANTTTLGTYMPTNLDYHLEPGK